MATEELLKEREKTHGEYAEHARLTQQVEDVWRSAPGWAKLPLFIRETLHMIAHKCGRIVSGNPYVHDHYDDIAGYSILVKQRVEDKVGVLPAYAEEGEPAWTDFYAQLAARWGCTRQQAKEHALRLMYDAPAPQPQGAPGASGPAGEAPAPAGGAAGAGGLPASGTE